MGPFALAVLALVCVGCGNGDDAGLPSGFAVPEGCKPVGSPESAEGLSRWTFLCEDAEHVLQRSEAEPLFLAALDAGGWSQCGVAAGTWYFREGDRITTLAFAVDDRRDPTFGRVYVGQKARTVECP